MPELAWLASPLCQTSSWPQCPQRQALPLPRTDGSTSQCAMGEARGHLSYLGPCARDGLITVRSAPLAPKCLGLHFLLSEAFTGRLMVRLDLRPRLCLQSRVGTEQASKAYL